MPIIPSFVTCSTGNHSLKLHNIPTRKPLVEKDITYARARSLARILARSTLEGTSCELVNVHVVISHERVGDRLKFGVSQHLQNHM